MAWALYKAVQQWVFTGHAEGGAAGDRGKRGACIEAGPPFAAAFPRMKASRELS